VGAAEEAWQANAKGLCEGPLCSLVLRVKMGKTLDLYVPGGSCDTGWGTIGPADIPLGTIGLPTGSTVVSVERSGDWSHGKAVVTLEGDAKLTLYASMLSQGIVVETSGDRLRLFGSSQPRMVSLTDGKMKIHSTQFRHNPPVMGPVTPTFVAMPRDGTVRVFRSREAIAVPPADRAWMLVWWGSSGHFVRTDSPLSGRGFHQEAYLADFPVILWFDRAPTSIAAAKEGGLDFMFAEPGRRALLCPVEGATVFRAEATQKWADDPSSLRVGRAPSPKDHPLHYPLSARESFRYDASRDEAIFSEKVTSLALGPKGMKMAPLPPVAFLASNGSLGVKWPGPLEGAAGETEFGHVAGVYGSDTATWSVKGLGKYVNPPQAAQAAAREPKGLRAELEAQVGKMLEAGRLAPWTYADNIPISASRGEYYWGEPGEVLYLLARLHPVVSKEHQAALLECMADIRKAFPPESVPLLPADKGARRRGYDPGPSHVSKIIAAERGKRVSLFALYGLERYYALSGEKPTAEDWEACRKVIAAAFEEQGWATLYHLGHPNRFLPWMGRGEERERLRKEHGATDTWRGDRPAAVVNANRLFSGAIGAIRLARLVGDREAEQRAWWLFARAAVLRYALGKYAAWRYGANLAKMPPKPDWFWTWRGRGPQNWGGDLETTDWSKPQHDVQQVVEFAPDRVQLGHWAGVMGDRWTQRCTAQLVAFRHMTPELALFLRDHLKAECAALVRLVEWNHPVWYASFAEAILGWEHNMNHPSDAYQVFMARAQILDETPEQLTKWIDVPWLARGDLFYLGKLAETIKAYRADEWK